MLPAIIFLSMAFVGAFAAQLGWTDGLFSGSDEDSDDYGSTHGHHDNTSTDLLDPDAPHGGVADPEGGDFLDEFSKAYRGTDGDDFINAIGQDAGFEFTMRGGDDALIGTNNADDARLGAGDDNASLSGGDDSAQGQRGNDNIFGGTGNDTLSGGAGDDWLQGHGDDDWLYGDSGDDVLEGGYGDDNIFGGAGHDILSGDNLGLMESVWRGVDTLDGGAGNDELYLGVNDTGTGGAGEDMFFVFDIADADDDAAEITDFDTNKDSLMVQYDETATPVPELGVDYDAEADETLVRLNGLPVAVLDGFVKLTPEDITLTPMGAA